MTWGILLRVTVYFLLPPTDDLEKYAHSGTLYFSALTAHFTDYITFTSNIPPATYLIQAAIFKLMDPLVAIQGRAFLVLVALLDLAALQLLLSSARRMGSAKGYSFGLLCLLSAVLVPFEIWRDGMHYDHLTFFFTSFFAWSLTRLITDRNQVTGWVLVSVSGALLVSQSAVNSAIVPFTLLCVVSYLFATQKRYLSWLFALLVTLSLPVIVLMVISKKNRREAQESLTSNKAGPAMLMVVQRAYRYDAMKVRNLMQQSGAPDWYLWTYDHATPPYNTKTGKPAEGWLTLAQAFGVCFYPVDRNGGKGPWQFDFDPLVRYLEAKGPAHLLPIAQADAADAVSKPYRFAGFAPELSPRWIGVYGEVSRKIFFDAVRHNPRGMFRSFVEQQGIFSIYGPLFPYNTTQQRVSLFARAGLRTERSPLPFTLFFEAVTLVFAPVAWMTYVFMWLLIPLTIAKWWRNRTHRIQLTAPVEVQGLMVIPALCIAVVFSLLVGGENDRYFMQLVPYLILLAAGMPVFFSRNGSQNDNLLPDNLLTK